MLKINDVDDITFDCLVEIFCDLEQHGDVSELKEFCKDNDIDFEDAIKYFEQNY